MSSDSSKITLPGLLSEKIFEIPRYQRGYSWGEKQIADLIEDLKALVDEENDRTHYMGTVVIYRHQDKDEEKQVQYQVNELSVYDVIDGQQRLTSILLYLSVILDKLVRLDSAYESAVAQYLYYKAETKLRLGSSERDFFAELLKNAGRGTGIMTDKDTPQKRRLSRAAEMFRAAVAASDKECLAKLYRVITQKLVFTLYEVEKKSEIGMTFELMNSRGKGLTQLELLKNYFMYWIYRNEENDESRKEIERVIEKGLVEVYHQIGKCTRANDEQCLRVCWTIKCNHLAKNWEGYSGFKKAAYVPIRGFDPARRGAICQFIKDFIELLAKVARCYVKVWAPDPNSAIPGEYEWLSNILHTGNVANFLPLLVVAKLKLEEEKLSTEEYVSILKAVECYAYRVFLWGERRSNAGKSNFYKLGKELFDSAISPAEVIGQIRWLTNYYNEPVASIARLEKPFRWYKNPLLLLRYTLFEYEKYLLKNKNHGNPRISWEDTAAPSTHEHIFPQTPKPGSQWLKDWPDQSEVDAWRDDIGNLTLTMDNSSYGRNEFVVKCDRKDGKANYRISDLAQEREIFEGYNNHEYDRWTRWQVENRHKKIVAWIKSRWFDGTASNLSAVVVDESADDDAVLESSGQS